MAERPLTRREPVTHHLTVMTTAMAVRRLE